MSLQKIIKKIWYPDDDGPVTKSAGLLFPLALFYRGAIRIRNRAYDRGLLTTCRLPCPVISVGNITVGGTGKTPMVIMLADMLAARGRRPAILSRGYGGASRFPVNIVSDGKSLLMQPQAVGDEPVLMARKLPGIPVLTGPKRYLTGKAAIDQFGVDVLILDDAYQHRQIQRDVNILLLDGHNPIGNGFTLPAGPLREPVSAMARADVIVITGVRDGLSVTGKNVQSDLENIVPKNIPVFLGQHRPRDLIQGGSKSGIFPLDKIRGKRICAFAGIGSPEAFRKTLVASGAHITSFLAFDDHHRYTERDICDINGAVQRGQADLMITTEKDGVKLDGFPDFMRQVFLLRIAMEIHQGQDDFTALILAGLESWKKQRPPR